MKVWHSLVEICSLTYWATFAAQLVAMPAFSIGTATWLTHMAKKRREDRGLEEERLLLLQKQEEAMDGVGPAAFQGKANDQAINGGAEDGDEGVLQRLTVYQGGAFMAGFIGEGA